MARSPKRLAGPLQLANADALLYTAPTYIPAAQTTVLRQIHLYCTAATTIFLSIGADTAANRIVDGLALATGEERDINVYIPLASAETIRGHAVLATSVNVTLGGDEGAG
jgi:hypothetical protein